MRNISFSLTTPQFLDGTKTVTRPQGGNTAEPAAWLVGWHRANGDAGLKAYVNEDDARKAAKNLEAYSASETMADVQPLYAAPTPSPAESVTTWQPIGSEPKGERILLCWADHPTLAAHVELGKHSASGAYTNTYGKAFSDKPTHWMPLPDAPALSRESRGGAT